MSRLAVVLIAAGVACVVAAHWSFSSLRDDVGLVLLIFGLIATLLGVGALLQLGPSAVSRDMQAYVARGVGRNIGKDMARHPPWNSEPKKRSGP